MYDILFHFSLSFCLLYVSYDKDEERGGSFVKSVWICLLMMMRAMNHSLNVSDIW